MNKSIVITKKDNVWKNLYIGNYDNSIKKANIYYNEGIEVFIKTISKKSKHLYKVKQRKKRGLYNNSIVLKQIY